jgi:hypothetical protein
MTMQGAKVRESAFTVATVPLPPQDPKAGNGQGLPPERVLAAMREQMLRNIGAAAGLPLKAADVVIVNRDGLKTGTMQLQSVSATGAGRHAATQLQGRFGLWRGHALQIVAVGEDLDPEQAAHFLDSLRLVEP